MIFGGERTATRLEEGRAPLAGIEGASTAASPRSGSSPHSRTNTGYSSPLYRRPLVLNLPTNHWESADENIQCKSTNYQTSPGDHFRARRASLLLGIISPFRHTDTKLFNPYIIFFTSFKKSQRPCLLQLISRGTLVMAIIIPTTIPR